MKIILAILSIVTLASCEAPPKPRWYKSGVSTAETRNQHAECVYNVGINKVHPTKENSLIKACMVSKGFRWGVPRQY